MSDTETPPACECGNTAYWRRKSRRFDICELDLDNHGHGWDQVHEAGETEYECGECDAGATEEIEDWLSEYDV